MPHLRVKICCIQSESEVAAAVAAGAAALGFVGEMPSGPGMLTDQRIAELVPFVPPFVVPVLLTSRTDPDAIVEQVARCRVRAVQLCAPLDPPAAARLRGLLPGVACVHVVHVTGPESITEARALAPLADALLLDTGVREGPQRQLGGTGRTHDWMVSREIVRAVTKPVILAGGLEAGNVGAALTTVRPWAVDVCSGVRTEGRLDPVRLSAFFAAVRSGGCDEPDA